MARAFVSRRSVVAGTLGLAGSGLVQRIDAQEAPREFRVGYQKAGLLAVAKEQGVLERRLKPLGVESVKWTEFELGLPMMKAISAGAIDFGWAGDTPAIFALAGGARFVLAGCMPASAHGLLVTEGSAIRSLADIKGRKIAFTRGTSAHNITLRLLAKAGLTYNDIVPVYLSPADGAKALVDGSVDAWVVWDPLFALAQTRQKVRVIATTKDIVNGNSVYVANPDFAAKHRKTLAAAIEEVTRVTEWAAQNRDQFAEKLAAAIGIDRDVERLAVGRTDLVAGPITPTITAQLQETTDAFEKLRLIPKSVVIRDAVWPPPGN